MGANLDKIYFVTGHPLPDGEKRTFNPATDMPALVETAKNIPGGVRLLVLDPIVSAIGAKTDSHKNSDTRSALQPVLKFAKDANCPVLGITHLTKGTQGHSPIDRVTGSLAFGALARIVMIAAKNERNDSEMPPRVLALEKSNLGISGGGFGFDIIAEPLSGHKGNVTKVIWHPKIEGSARDILAGMERGIEKEGRPSTKISTAKTFLECFLMDGKEKRHAEIKEEALKQGISEKNLWRASEKLNVRRWRGTDGFIWQRR
jgi:hypothetical protein